MIEPNYLNNPTQHSRVIPGGQTLTNSSAVAIPLPHSTLRPFPALSMQHLGPAICLALLLVGLPDCACCLHATTNSPLLTCPCNYTHARTDTTACCPASAEKNRGSCSCACRRSLLRARTLLLSLRAP